PSRARLIANLIGKFRVCHKRGLPVRLLYTLDGRGTSKDTRELKRIALSRARDSARERYVGEGSWATCVQVAQRVRVGRFLANVGLNNRPGQVQRARLVPNLNE